MSEPAYTRLQVDERRRQLLEAGAQLFAEHAFEEISMRQIAERAGVSKALLYHYFPSKTDLFKAAIAEAAGELQALIEPSGQGAPLEQLARSLDAYLAWIEANAQTWSKLMESAATLPDARELVEGFRQHTMQMILSQLTADGPTPPALRNAIQGWLGYMDAAILDWTQTDDLAREQLRDLLLAAFTNALTAAQQIEAQPRSQ
ncbi:MAG TPA: TetR/AcrR family transcriptional regulator [Solirubrobacteraceae bacterium]|nr:TetR/AcrR family transcriptional regulator [Solirubrobacteraceae bacterium]